MGRLLGLIAMFLAGACAAWLGLRYWPAWPGTPAAPLPSALTPAAEAPIPSKIVAQGRLQPRGGVVNVVVPPGQQIEDILVSERQPIVAGRTELLTLRSRQLLRLQADLAAARRSEATLELSRNRMNAEISVRSARRAVSDARSQLAMLEQATELQIAEKELALAQRQLDSLNALAADHLTRSLVSAAQLDEQRIRLETARLRFEQAGRQRESGLASARSAVEATEAALADAERAAEMARQLEEENRSPQLGQELAEEQLRQSRILAPIDGTVLRILLQPGETATTIPVMQVGNLQRMECVAEVSELFARRVGPGMAVTLRSPSLPAELRGWVRDVGVVVGRASLPDPNPLALVDRRTIEVLIDLDEDSTELARNFSNLQVTVQIHTGQSVGDPADEAS